MFLEDVRFIWNTFKNTIKNDKNVSYFLTLNLRNLIFFNIFLLFLFKDFIWTKSNKIDLKWNVCLFGETFDLLQSLHMFNIKPQRKYLFDWTNLWFTPKLRYFQENISKRFASNKIEIFQRKKKIYLILQFVLLGALRLEKGSEHQMKLCRK